MMRGLILGLLGMLLLAGCGRQTDLSGLGIFETTVDEAVGSKWVVYYETGGTATPLINFQVVEERPRLFVQTGLPDGKMWVIVATSTGSQRSVTMPDVFDSQGHEAKAYGRLRTGNQVVILRTTGSTQPPSRIYVAPAP